MILMCDYKFYNIRTVFVLFYSNLNNMIIKFILIGCLLCIISPNAVMSACRTAKNEIGTCQQLFNCTIMLDLVSQRNITEENRQYLQRSQCGFDNSNPIASPAQQVLICCPHSVVYPETTTVSTTEATVVAGNVLPDEKLCGVTIQNRIYGGNVSAIDEFPWMVLIEYLKSYNKSGFHCGGSLITNRYVLTAAHCVDNPDIPKSWSVHSVRLGEWDLNTNPDCITNTNGVKTCAPNHQDILVDSWISHPAYMPKSREQYNDLAIIRLKSIANYNDYVKPICLPIAEELRTNLFENTFMNLAGWGRTETSKNSRFKSKIEIKVWSAQECIEKYNNFPVALNESSQICAGGEKGIDACTGDSGGALSTTVMVKDNRAISVLVGIVSFGPKPCALDDWPGVYTRSAHYIDWILANLQA